ncbi:MAG: hypothetical protein J6K25_02205 [Thermoguttaceae bacterium]|nr:hypothetical protein [Thermoguttaceae bacterium]
MNDITRAPFVALAAQAFVAEKTSATADAATQTLAQKPLIFTVLLNLFKSPKRRRRPTFENADSSFRTFSPNNGNADGEVGASVRRKRRKSYFFKPSKIGRKTASSASVWRYMPRSFGRRASTAPV